MLLCLRAAIREMISESNSTSLPKSWFFPRQPHDIVRILPKCDLQTPHPSSSHDCRVISHVSLVPNRERRGGMRPEL
jgi:hypothetical protein